MNDTKKITINDVAREAGVSNGTVDRVLHNRGDVAPESRKKVLEVVRKLGYKPNLYASMLAQRTARTIVCLIPQYSAGEFWALTAEGIASGAEENARYGIVVETVTYSQYELESFTQACASVLEKNPSGVIMAPMFSDETKSFTAQLVAKNIPYVFIDSRIDDNQYLAYYGMQMYDSGLMCAYMLPDGISDAEVTMVRIRRDRQGLSDPTAARRAGFMDFMKKHKPDCRLENVFITPQDPDLIAAELDKAFEGKKGKKYIVMFNSRIHLVCDYLKRRGMNNCFVIGFDALDRNIDALEDGLVDVIIAQHSDRQAAHAVKALTDKIIMKTDPQRRDNYSQIDILNRYNCKYYINK